MYSIIIIIGESLLQICACESGEVAEIAIDIKFFE